MKNWYLKLSLVNRSVVWSTAAFVLVLICTIWCYFLGLNEIPQGIMLGGLVGLVSYLLLGIAENLDKKKNKLTFTIIFTILRFILIAAIIFLAAFLYYKLEAKIFNVFAVVGGYFIPFFSYLIVNLVNRRKE